MQQLQTCCSETAVTIKITTASDYCDYCSASSLSNFYGQVSSNPTKFVFMAEMSFNLFAPKWYNKNNSAPLSCSTLADVYKEQGFAFAITLICRKVACLNNYLKVKSGKVQNL